MKKLLSYFWPFTKKYHSDINGTLEVNYINGRKVLDSKNANYSFGELQKRLERGLLKIDLQRIDKILILGMGGGSVIASLKNKFKFAGEITAVEIDPVVIKIAKEEFDIKPTHILRIVEANAFEFVQRNQQKYQLIIIDIFIDTKVPPELLEKQFWKNISKSMDKEGLFIMNMGVNATAATGVSERLKKVTDDFEFHENPEKNLSELLIGRKT